MPSPSRTLGALASLLLLAAPALAHGGTGAAGGFASGFLHRSSAPTM